MKMYYAVPANILFLLALLASQPDSVHGALQHRPLSSFPVDTFASPKYGVSFLNDRPIGRKEADLWRQGLKPSTEAALRQELSTSRDGLGHRDVPRAEEETLTWQSVFEGTAVISNQQGDLLHTLWSDPLFRDQYRLEDSDYPKVIPVKLPSAPGSYGERPRLSDLTRQNTTKTHETHDYLCAMPVVSKPSPAVAGKNMTEKQDAERDVAPDALDVYRHLDPLDGSCLYHRQGWFTYAYCHNSHIRQFREAASPPAISAPKPVEDMTFEAYDLGVSPLSLEQRLDEYRMVLEDAEAEGLVSKAFVPDPEDPTQEIEVIIETQVDPAIGLQIREMESILARMDREQKSADDPESLSATPDEKIVRQSLSIHSNAQARYLVEVWEGGTICDMTGKARKIEVEFHCGGDGPDGIVGVKEISTCQYIMTIKTPRICAIPGFYVPSASLGPTHQIQCRRIVHDDDLRLFTAAHASGDDQKIKESRRAPLGWETDRRPYTVTKSPAHSRQKDTRMTSETEFEVIVPGVGGQPPQRIIKPAKLRKRQNSGDAEDATEGDKTALAEQRAAAMKQRAADRERRAERNTLQQEIRRSVDEDWETYYFVRLARFVGYYKKGGTREQKDKKFLYETLEEEVRRLQAEEDAQRKKMET